MAYGEVLYPYYDARTRSFSFDFLNNTGYLGNLTVAKEDIYPLGGLQEASLGAAGLSKDDQGLHVEFLYVADQK